MYKPRQIIYFVIAQYNVLIEMAQTKHLFHIPNQTQENS